MEDYIKIYDECLNKSYHNPKLEPLINYLYELIKRSNKEIAETVKLNTDEDKKKSTIKRKTHFMKEYLSIFNKIIDSNNYDNFDEYFNFYLESNSQVAFFVDLLCAIYDKENFYLNRNFEYTFLFIELTSAIRNNTYTKDYNFDIYNMLLCYKKYVDIIDNDDSLRHLTRLFDRYGSIIISFYNRYGCDIDDLDNLFSEIIYKPDEFFSYLELNGIKEDEMYIMVQKKEAYVIETMVRNRISKKKVLR